MAKVWGWSLLPWQTQVADVACELREDGRWAYPTVVLTVPRQVGKTALVFSVGSQRAMQLQGHRGWYTAQTGHEARRTYRDEWLTLTDHRMPGQWHQRRGAGEETLTWKATGGFWRVFPPVRTALHGAQADLVVLDEAWAYDQEQGTALLQGIIPTQTTRKRRQVWIVSTAGTPESVWARSWVERGRNAERGVAYFEWSAPPDADPDDEAVWLSSHPAVDQLVTLEDLRDFRATLGRDGFARAYLNVWPDLPVESELEATLDQAAWKAGRDRDSGIVGAPVFAADSDPISHVAHVAAVGVGKGRPSHVELVKSAPGAVWLPSFLEGLVARHGGLVACDDGGPVGWVAEELERMRVPMVRVKPGEYARGCAQLSEAVAANQVAHLEDARLDTAVAAALRKPMGRGWVWDRSRSPADVSPLVAVTLAFTAAVTHARPAVEPSRIY